MHTYLRDDAYTGVNAGLFDIFLWETFTSQPYIDKGEIVKVGFVSALTSTRLLSHDIAVLVLTCASL